ncbi:hypothetical protein BJV77DRAFT_966631 [Russula vinacea]|nr:hypothetical protein BJV77DRAFT_966631 [Russula vinacea]
MADLGCAQDEDGDTLQHWLYTYSDRSGEPENRSGGDRVERTPTTERVGGIPLPNQIRAETPGMHQTKPHPRSSPRASKRRRTGQAPSGADGPIDGAGSEVSGHEYRAELRRRLSEFPRSDSYSRRHPDELEGLVEGLQVRGRRSEDLRSELSDPERLCSGVEFA